MPKVQNVLIVDDSKIARQRIKTTLESLGYNDFIEAIDGLDGIEKVKNNQVDLIIADLEMPNLDGISMIKEIRAYNATVPIVVVSSMINTPVIQEVTQLGASFVKNHSKKSAC